jgi:RNA polymerase sigma-70 factor (ECF subfamily)
MNTPGIPRSAATATQYHPEGLEGAFAAWQAELLGMLYYMTGNAEDAQDALQEAFIKCWRHRGELAGINNLRAWVFRVALNTARDLRATAWRRHRSRVEPTQLRLVAADDQDPSQNAQHQEQLERLRKALMELRPEEQEVFLLRQDGQLTYEQIAEVLNIPVGTVKTRMRLALARLREALKQ